MSVAIKNLTVKELNSLQGYLVPLVYWMRELHPTDAGDVILAILEKKKDPKRGHLCLRSILFAEKSGREVTISALRKLLKKYDMGHWVNGFLLLLTTPNEDMMWSSYAFDGLVEAAADSSASMCALSLRRISYPAYDALRAICSMLIQTTNDIGRVSYNLGPLILLGANARSSPTTKLTDASNGFKFLLQNYDAAFMEGQEKNLACTAFGITIKADMSSVQAVQTELIAQLKGFYEHMDIQFAGIAEELFDLHEFTDIAREIYKKYESMPEEWIEILRAKQIKGEKLDWFNYERVLSGHAVPVLMRGPSFQLGSGGYGHISKQDQPIDEFIDTEIVYYEKLRGFQDIFVDELRAVAAGTKGFEKKDALGIAEREIELYFGVSSEVRKVMKFSAELLARLEVINLIRNPTKDGARSRARVLADVFLDMSEKLLKVYEPYAGWYDTTSVVVSRQMSQAKKMKRRNGMLSFEQLYHRISNDDKYLNGSTILSLLIEPVQRMPRYQILFDRILKVEQDKDIKSKVLKGLELVKGITAKVDYGVKQKKKIAQLLGSDIEDEEKMRARRLDDALEESGFR